MTVVSLFCIEESPMPLDLIFLDTNGSSVFTDWRYHRLTAIGESIEMCQVTFPEFSDPGTPIQTPGIITFPLAIKKGAEILMHQYAVDPRYTTFIGQRERT